MRMKPKTARRLALLAAVIVVGAGGFVGLVLVRAAQNARIEATLRADGMDAYADGRPYDALQTLGRYLRRSPEDAEALLAYAKSRVVVEETGGRHLREAVAVYQRYVDLNRSDTEARLELAHLYNQVGLYLEARQASRDLRPAELADATADDADAIYEESVALLGLARTDADFEALTDRLIALGDDVRAVLLKIEAMSRQGKDAAAYASSLVEHAPGRAAWKVVEAVTRARDASEAERAALASQVATAIGLDPQTGAFADELAITDPLILREAIGVLDSLGRFDLTLSVLDRAAQETGDVEWERALARRLAQSMQFDRIVTRFARTEPELADADTELLAFLAMAQLALDRYDLASAYVDRLASRAERDFRADAWSKALRLAMPEGAETLSRRINVLRQALETDPGETMIARMLAESLEELGRDEEAIRLWRQILLAQDSTAWVEPRVRLAQALMRTGQPLEALAAAETGLRIAPANAMANVAWYGALVQLLEGGAELELDVDGAIDRLRRVRELLAQSPASDQAGPILDQLLLSHARLLCVMHRNDEARQVITEALGATRETGELTLHALGSLSREQGLGLEGAILESASEAFGETPALVYARAIELAESGDVDGAIAMFEDAAPPPGRDREWAVGRANLLEAVGRVDAAAAAWKSLFEMYGTDLDVIRLVLESPAAARDRELIDAAIDRHRALTDAREGDMSVLDATARARSLLNGRPTREERDQAISLLQRVALERRGAVDIRQLLARAHLLNDPSRDVTPDLAAAVSELEAASRLAPADDSIALELAEVLQMRREFSRARDLLSRMATDEQNPTPTRLHAARLLIDQGEDQAALAALRSLARTVAQTDDPRVVFSLARAYERLGEHPKAMAEYERLADMQLDDPAIVAGVWSAFESAGRRDRAGQMEARLAALDLEPARLAYYRGLVAERAGRVDDAIASYRDAVDADPDPQAPQIALISLLIESGRLDDAVAQATRAHDRSPQDPRLLVLLEQARFAAAGDGGDLSSLIEAMRRDPDSTRLGEALQQISAARDAGRLDDPEVLREFVQHYRDTLAMQLFGAARLSKLGNEHLPEAVGIAEQAMRTFPDAPEPARLATELNRTLARWPSMLASASAWRRRATDAPVEAELAVAQAQMQLGRYADAAETLRPHVRNATKDLAGPVDVSIVQVYVNALAGSGRLDQALAVLDPLLERSSAIRARVALPLGAGMVNDIAQAEGWIDQVRAHVPADSVEEQVALAGALSSLAQRADAPDRTRLLNEALDTLHALISRDLATPLVLESIGKMHHALGDIDAAESAYRQALAQDPDLVDSLNNLASIVLDRRHDPQEAVRLAKRAVQGAAPGSLTELATLGEAMEAHAASIAPGGDAEQARIAYAGAADAYARILDIQPAQPGYLWRLARASEKAGDPERAIDAYERLLELPSLTDDVRLATENNLAVLLLNMNRGPADLERALDLATKAAAGGSDASFQETLGRARLALGRRADAIDAYRRALDQRPDMIIAMIGLATALSEGDDDARHEADALIQRVERLIEDGARVSPDVLRSYEQLTRQFTSAE